MVLITLILVFLLVLISSLLGIFILYPLLIGLFLFGWIAVRKGWPAKEVWKMAFAGAWKVLPLLQIFFFIGILIGFWFASGTMAGLVYYGIRIMIPQMFLLFCFLLCALVSLLMGTSFGTIGTMGTVLVIIARMSQVEPAFVVGACIGGAYVGDRISPMSSSAHLVAIVTQTNIYQNVRSMSRTMWLPFFASCGLYILLSLIQPLKTDTDQTFLLLQIPESFQLSLWNFLPICILVFFVSLRIQVKWAMALSALSAMIVATIDQGLSLDQSLRTLIMGFSLPKDDPLSSIFQGGGIQFMAKPIMVVIVSSAFAGLFGKTGMAQAFTHKMERLSQKMGRFFSAMVTSLLTASLGCTQTLSIIMTHHFLHTPYKKLNATARELALDLEDTSVLLSVMIPWNVAGAIPAQMLGYDARFIPFAFFLYLVPLFRWGEELIHLRRGGMP